MQVSILAKNIRSEALNRTKKDSRRKQDTATVNKKSEDSEQHYPVGFIVLDSTNNRLNNNYNIVHWVCCISGFVFKS